MRELDVIGNGEDSVVLLREGLHEAFFVFV